jgi:hypothetical protein
VNSILVQFREQVCLNFEVVCIDLKFGSNEFHERIVDGKNDLENVLNDILVPYIVTNLSDYNDAIHYLLECPLYTNARMQLIMSITPYTVISIESLLFGSDNLTDENNLIVFPQSQLGSLIICSLNKSAPSELH